MSEFASNADKFIMTFFEPISESAPHIYISALPFASQHSVLSHHFMKYFLKTLKFEKGHMKYKSESCVLRIKGGNSSLAYSPDGRHIVSVFFEGHAQVCDALTGHSVMSLESHDGHSASPVAYSPDGKYIECLQVQFTGPKKDQNRTEPNSKILDHQLRLHKF